MVKLVPVEFDALVAVFDWSAEADLDARAHDSMVRHEFDRIVDCRSRCQSCGRHVFLSLVG